MSPLPSQVPWTVPVWKPQGLIAWELPLSWETERLGSLAGMEKSMLEALSTLGLIWPQLLMI